MRFTSLLPFTVAFTILIATVAHAAQSCSDFKLDTQGEKWLEQWAHLTPTKAPTEAPEPFPGSLMQPGECWKHFIFTYRQAATVHATLKQYGISKFMAALSRKNSPIELVQFYLLNISEASFLQKSIAAIHADIDTKARAGIFKPSSAARLKTSVEVVRIGTFALKPGSRSKVTVYEIRYITLRSDLNSSASWPGGTSDRVINVMAVSYIRNMGSDLANAFGVIAGPGPYVQVGVGQSYEAKQARDSFKYLVPIAGAGG